MDRTVQFVRKWSRSGTSNCPALYLMDGSESVIEAGAAHQPMLVPDDALVVVQGWRTADSVRAQLRGLATNEDAVLVPADVIAGIVVARRNAA